MLLIYTLDLPATQDLEAFLAFMKDSYVPALRMTQTRVGRSVHARLLQQADTETGRRFYWLVEQTGLSSGRAIVDSEEVETAFAKFGAPMEFVGVFESIVERHADHQEEA